MKAMLGKALGRLLRVASGIVALVIIGWVIFYFGIYLGYGNWKVRGHQEFATNGLSQIEPANQMNSLFEDCRHFITYGPDDVPLWNAVAYFGGRYTLTMQVPVKIDSATSGHITGDPKFWLLEVASVEISSSGQVGATFSRQFKFGPNEWQGIYLSKGNFEKIGLKTKGPPVKDFDVYAKASR